MRFLRTHMNKKNTGKPKSKYKWCVFFKDFKSMLYQHTTFSHFYNGCISVYSRTAKGQNLYKYMISEICYFINVFQGILPFPLSLQGQEGKKRGGMVVVFKEELNTIMTLHGGNNSIMHNHGSHLFYNSCQIKQLVPCMVIN